MMKPEHRQSRKSKRARIADKSAGKCWYCGCTLSEATRTHDHVIPRSENGLSNEQNLVLSCVACNNQKRNLSLEEYREYVGGVIFYGETVNHNDPRMMQPANGRNQRPV